MHSYTFEFPGVYNLSDLADYIGGILGIHLRVRNVGDIVHGYLNQSISRDENHPLGKTILTISFYDEDKPSTWVEGNPTGNVGHLKPFVPVDGDYQKVEQALMRLFCNEEDSVKQLTQEEVEILFT